MARHPTAEGIGLDDLRAWIEGEVIAPGDAGYDQHRAVFNAMVDRRPLAILRCRSREDVINGLAFRAQHDLPVAVRCGGTSPQACVEGGIVLDLSPMQRVQVDPDGETARLDGGLTWADMDLATQEHGLAVTGGRLSRLGVAGVTLDGGSGWLERALGPTCASLVGAEVVLADGGTVTASEDQNPDLLWALRGGGGGFGVVTELEFRLRPVGPTVLAGFLTYPRERAGELTRAYRDYMADAPDEVGGGLVLFPGRAGALTVVFCYLGSIEAGERAVAPLRELGPSLDAVAPNEYRAFQSMSDLQNPFGMRARLRGGFLRELPDEALELVIVAANRPASSLSQVALRPLRGAIRRVDREGMALKIPDAPWAYECLGLWPPLPSLDRGNAEWTRTCCEAMERFALTGAYPGLIDTEGGTDELVASYGPEGYARLQRVKARYDPKNVFRSNKAIEPVP